LLKRPGGQEAQVEPDKKYEPLGHKVQASQDEEPAAEHVPLAQLVHDEAEVWPAALPYLPATQAAQAAPEK